MPTIEPDRGRLVHGTPPRMFAGAPAPSHAGSALEQVWRAVRVLGIDTRRAVDGSGLQVVQARVHLGALLPLDVLVELACTFERGEASTRWRMWSDHPQGGGNFVFEVRLPDVALAGAATLSVCVYPAPDSPTDSVRMSPAELSVAVAPKRN